MEITVTRSQITADNVHFNNSITITLLAEEKSQREWEGTACPRVLIRSTPIHTQTLERYPEVQCSSWNLDPPWILFLEVQELQLQPGTYYGTMTVVHSVGISLSTYGLCWGRPFVLDHRDSWCMTMTVTSYFYSMLSILQCQLGDKHEKTHYSYLNSLRFLLCPFLCVQCSTALCSMITEDTSQFADQT